MAPGEGGDAPMVTFGTKLAGPAGGLLLTAAAIFSLRGNISGGITAATSRHLCARPRRTAPGLVRPGQRALRDSGQFDPVHGRPDRLARADRQLRLAGGGQHAGPADRLFAGIAALPKLERADAARPLIYVMMAAGLAVCLWAALQSAWESWRMLLILIAAGTLLYFAGALRRSQGPR